MSDPEKDPNSVIDRILGDVSRRSAVKQLIIGVSSGWITGFVAMKIGKTTACVVGGTIILLEIAYKEGYIKVNWDKVNKHVDKVSDRVEEEITGEGPNWIDRMGRYVNRKLDKAEELMNDGKSKAKSWYSSIMGNNGDDGKLREIHIFLVSFVAGVALGITTF